MGHHSALVCGAAILRNRGVRVSASIKSDGERASHERGVGLATRARRWTTLATMAVVGPGLLVVSACSSSDSKPEANSPTSPTVSPTPPSDSDEKSADAGGETPVPGAEPSSIPVPDVVRDDTEEASSDFVDTMGDVLEEPDSSEQVVPSVTGAALEELRNRIAEYEASGWRVVGEAVIVRQKVVQYVDDPESAVVRACVDNSRVRVIDAKGKTVPGSAPATPRTLNIFTMVKEKDAWVISESRLAPQPDC